MSRVRNIWKSLGNVHTLVKIIFPFLLTLAPSDGFADTFPDTFPDKRGRLTVCILSFYGVNQVIHL